MKIPSFIWMFFFSFFALFFNARIWAQTEAIQKEIPQNETVIKGQRIHKTKPHAQKVPLSEEAQRAPSQTEGLLSVPGVTLTQPQGPLGPSSVRYRGLSHARLPIDLEGLPLNDPATGIINGNSLFLFAASDIMVYGQSLGILLPRFLEPTSKARFGVGSFQTIRASAFSGSPVGEHGQVLWATEIFNTKGDYEYHSRHTPEGQPPVILKKINNDQHNLQSLFHYDYDDKNKRLKTLATLNTHEGGISGFALAPNPSLRNRSFSIGLALDAGKIIRNAEFSLKATNTLSNFQSIDKGVAQPELTTSQHEITFGLSPQNMSKNFSMFFGPQFLVSRAYELDKTRYGMGFYMERTMKFPYKMEPTLYGLFNMKGIDQLGLLFNKTASFSIAPTSNWKLSLQFARKQRVPTFLELYAHEPFFQGNPKLEKEGMWDIELASSLFLPYQTRLHIKSFYGQMHDLIVYVPYLANLFRPENTGDGRRAGLEFSMSFEPKPWFLAEANVGYLYTHMLATKKPLPQAPHYTGLIKTRIGLEEMATLTLQTRLRGSATANIYGSLVSPAYSLFDATGYVRIKDPFALSISVSNIFDVKSAEDIYQQPLPGRYFYAQLEVGRL